MVKNFIAAAIVAVALMLGVGSTATHIAQPQAAHADFGDWYDWTPDTNYNFVWAWSPWAQNYIMIPLTIEVLTAPNAWVTFFINGMSVSIQADNWGMVGVGGTTVGSITSTGPIYTINTGGAITYGSGWGTGSGGGNSVPYFVGSDCFGEFGC